MRGWSVPKDIDCPTRPDKGERSDGARLKENGAEGDVTPESRPTRYPAFFAGKWTFDKTFQIRPAGNTGNPSRDGPLKEPLALT